MAKPTVLPEFATDPVLVDPTSGQNNVVEPSATLKQYGWHPFRFRPLRNVFNWVHHHTYNWLDWLDTEVEPQLQVLNDSAIIGTVDMSLRVVTSLTSLGWTSLSAGSSGTIRVGDIQYLDFTANWTKIRDVIYLHMPLLWGNINDAPSDAHLIMLTEPPEWDLSGEQMSQLICKQFNDPYFINGMLTINAGNPLITVATMQSPLAGSDMNYMEDYLFERSNANSGIARQTIVLHGDDQGWPEIP